MRARYQQSNDSGGEGFVGREFFAPLGPDGPKFRLPARWSIRVVALSGKSISVKLAVGFGETLETMEATTPAQFDFVASSYTALIAAKNPHDQIKAEIWSDLYGEFQLNGMFGGQSTGKFTFDPGGPSSSAGTGLGG